MNNKLKELAAKYGKECTCDPDVNSTCLSCSVLLDLCQVARVYQKAMVQVSASYINLVHVQYKDQALQHQEERIVECIERAWKEEV